MATEITKATIPKNARRIFIYADCSASMTGESFCPLKKQGGKSGGNRARVHHFILQLHVFILRTTSQQRRARKHRRWQLRLEQGTCCGGCMGQTFACIFVARRH